MNKYIISYTFTYLFLINNLLYPKGDYVIEKLMFLQREIQLLQNQSTWSYNFKININENSFINTKNSDRNDKSIIAFNAPSILISNGFGFITGSAIYTKNNNNYIITINISCNNFLTDTNGNLFGTISIFIQDNLGQFYNSQLYDITTINISTTLLETLNILPPYISSFTLYSSVKPNNDFFSLEVNILREYELKINL